LRAKRLALAILATLLLGGAAATSAWAVGGPVILGGDDLTDHGSTDLAGNSQDGWLYIEKAVANIKPKIGRQNDNSIAAFGSADPGPVVPGSGGDAGMAIKNAAQKNGMTVAYYDTAAEINSGMASISNGSYRPAMIWLAGTGAGNDFGFCDDGDPNTQSEAEAVTANASVINDFVNQGGGLMSHGTCYSWLSTLLPGLTTVDGGSSDDLELTQAGTSAFPGLTNDDVNAGPWHNHFEGNFGGLDVLVHSTSVQDSQTGGNAAVVIGGGQVSLTQKPADLFVRKAGTVSGRDISYTVTVGNNGPNPASGVTMVDTLPAGVTLRSATPSQGSCSSAGSQVTCGLGDLAAGASATVKVVVRPSSSGTYRNGASVSGNQPDPDNSNNSATADTAFTLTQTARRDRTKPRVTVAGVARGCVRIGFTARFRIRESSLRSVSVFLDGRRILRTSRKTFRVRVNTRRLRSGRHRLRAVAVDRAGNRRTVRWAFTRCARPAAVPHFTG
jgi:uncharacterized repeat protein (TIGR01451 family)